MFAAAAVDVVANDVITAKVSVEADTVVAYMLSIMTPRTTGVVLKNQNNAMIIKFWTCVLITCIILVNRVDTFIVMYRTIFTACSLGAAPSCKTINPAIINEMIEPTTKQ
jgi:hypothetical protein